MMHFRLYTRSQLLAYQYAYGNKTASGVCLQNIFDYSPFGAALDGRTMQGDAYRYGFNTQEKVDEISGRGNHFTAMFWEYDTRLGRRWNIDPVIKANYSSYLAFGNNPIILIDPNGRTDYYNTKGKKIGTDGIDNSEKRMAINVATQKIIIDATKEDMSISMDSKIYEDIVQIPNQSTLKNMRKMWRDTRKGKEQTMMVGKNASGNEIQLVKEGTEVSAPTGIAFDEMRDKGVSPLYSVHTHPFFVKINESTGGVTVSTTEPSWRDVQTAGDLGEIDPVFNSNGNQQIVIGPNYAYETNPESGDEVLGSTVMISFYNKENTTQKHPEETLHDNTSMKPNASMNFRKFLRAAKKANKI